METLLLACCNGCDAEVEKIDKRGSPRLISGAMRIGGIAYCKKCRDARYVLRAITFPIIGPVGAEWKDLRESLNKAWGQSTSLSNWFMTEFYASDVRREPGQAKLGPMPTLYLYPKARERFPDYPSALLVTIEHAASGKYRSKRWELLWTGGTSLPVFRFPVPYPVRGADWSAFFDDGNRPMVNANIAGVRFDLRLKGGPQYRRQLASFRQIVDGSAKQGEMALYKQGDQEMCKLVAWLPRPPAREKPDAPRTFSVRSDKDCFLYGVLQGREEPWVLNADLAMKWIADHDRFRQRMAEDNKYEVRQSRKHRGKVKIDCDARCEKQRNRIKSFIDETAASVAKFCVRNDVTDVTFMDSETGHGTHFPWFILKEKLLQKLDFEGIAFYAESKENPIEEIGGNGKPKKKRSKKRS